MPVTMNGAPKPSAGRRGSNAGPRGAAPPSKKPNRPSIDEAAPLLIDTEIFETTQKLKISEALDINSPELGFLPKGSKIAIRRRAEVATMCATLHT